MAGRTTTPILAAVALLAAAGGARALTVTQTLSAFGGAKEPLDYSGETLGFTRFDPALGDLRSVSLTLDARATVDLLIIGASPTPETYLVEVDIATTAVSAAAPGGGGATVDLALDLTADVPAIGGAPFESLGNVLARSTTVTLVAPGDDASGYVGSGTIDVILGTISAFALIGPGAPSPLLDATGGADVTLIYDFDPRDGQVVPLAPAGLLLVSALGAFGAVRRRRR